MTMDPSISIVSEKLDQLARDRMSPRNPVVDSSEYAFKATALVQINDEGVRLAAAHIRGKLCAESYTPRTWRTHPLHICPSDPYDPMDPLNELVLNWIFLISSLNFSFWSEKEGQPDRYGVEWYAAWGSEERKVWTGYWSLVAALNRALEDDIPITDPHFYSSETLCPDSLIEHIFRPATQSSETIPLLRERISIMREVGFILCNSFGGSARGFINEFQRRYNNEGTALQLVRMVTETFPSFRDEFYFREKKSTVSVSRDYETNATDVTNTTSLSVYIWKRAQILVAETWAAFYPEPSNAQHPLFPGPHGAQIRHLTMFADYRVPQILHHLHILTYPPSLMRKLHAGSPIVSGSRDELSLRASSIVAVERVREEILRLMNEEDGSGGIAAETGVVSSVVIDFYLWDLAKKIENGTEKVDGVVTAEMVPTHRTRSIWY